MTQPTDLLPPAAQALADCIGLPALLAWVEAEGGQSRRVPVVPDHASELCHTLGRDAYDELCYHYQGEIVEVPLLHTSRSKLFRAQVRAELQAGARVCDLVRKYRVTRFSVARIRREIDAEEQQARQGLLQL